ncbi:MAG TPA: hypothetical protein VKS01_12820 [Bryobacteraceae bacterium]|nr:hypothetical protein [Bryobacteraceae bacterium]
MADYWAINNSVSKTFWIFFGIAVAGAAIVAGVIWQGTKGAHLELDGRILHVRTYAVNPKATIVIVDFRETNPSDVSFTVKDVQMTLEGVNTEPGQIVSRHDLNTLFQYEKLLGPKYNDSLSTGDQIAPHQTVDRMVGARFEVGESAIEARKAVHVQFLDLYRAVAELKEDR